MEQGEQEAHRYTPHTRGSPNWPHRQGRKMPYQRAWGIQSVQPWQPRFPFLSFKTSVALFIKPTTVITEVRVSHLQLRSGTGPVLPWPGRRPRGNDTRKGRCIDDTQPASPALQSLPGATTDNRSLTAARLAFQSF